MFTGQLLISSHLGIIDPCLSMRVYLSRHLVHFRERMGASQVMLVVKNLPANAGDVGDVGSIPGSGRSPGGRLCNPLQSSCLQNPMDRGAWQAI